MPNGLIAKNADRRVHVVVGSTHTDRDGYFSLAIDGKRWVCEGIVLVPDLGF
jgi:hypothetical protein